MDLDIVGALRTAIEERNFVGWRGFPHGTKPEPLFDVTPDSLWAPARLGEKRVPALRRLLELEGYYRPLLYCREGDVVLFEGMNPKLARSWAEIESAAGEPDEAMDWRQDSLQFTAGERIYARRGIAFRVNPANDFVIHVLLFAATSIEDYLQNLRPAPPPDKRVTLPGRPQ